MRPLSPSSQQMEHQILSLDSKIGETEEMLNEVMGAGIAEVVRSPIFGSQASGGQGQSPSGHGEELQEDLQQL